MEGSGQADRAAVQATLARNRLRVAALAASVLLLAAVSGFVDFGSIDFADRLSLPAGLAGLVMLVAGWRVYVTMSERASEVEDIATGCTRYTTALLTALALTEGFALLGIVAYTLGASFVALTGVFSHVLLTGVLWPGAEKIRPFLGRAGRSFIE